MNSFYMILSIPALAILDGTLSYFVQTLYHQVYSKHVAIEPANLTKLPLPKIIGQTIATLISFLVAPLFLWSQGYFETTAFYTLCGYIIGYLAFLVAKKIFSVLVFIYIKKNPSLVSGRVIFQFPVIRMINVASTIQQFIYISIIAFFVPSPFIIGAICGLAFAVIITYFSKFAQPVV